jgi:hypothetical protein
MMNNEELSSSKRTIVASGFKHFELFWPEAPIVCPPWRSTRLASLSGSLDDVPKVGMKKLEMQA